jgi:two-component system chemotaxis response regulator CheB
MRRIKVIVVDNSAVVRQVLGGLLDADPGIDLIGAVADPLLAMARMERQWPDVIVLDIDMPRMNGMTFLKKIMSERPTPVIVCSARIEPNGGSMAEARIAGAVAFIAKPEFGLRQFLTDRGPGLLSMVRAAAGVSAKPLVVTEKYTADVVLRAAARAGDAVECTEPVVALGASTGGTQALETVLVGLPRVSPGIVIVQHMPVKFTAEFAARLDLLCRIEVREARHNDRVNPGLALIAPGGKHMLLRRGGGHYFVEVIDGPLVSRHRPSVDVLFRSVAQSAGPNALGVIMTGMGDDGAAGLLEMREAGARTLAQDERSCVVYGMPKEALKRGGVERSVSLGEIGREIGQHLQQAGAR